MASPTCMAETPFRRGSTRALAVLALAVPAFAATWLDGGGANAERDAAAAGAVAARLELTDLALFSEARYTRHPSQADRHAAFQDHPLALEHFPAGSLVPPPGHREVELLPAGTSR